MTPKCSQKVCKNDTISRATPNMKNCDWTAQAAADGGSSDPENHKKTEKTTCDPTLSTHSFFFEKVTKKVPKLVP